MPRARREIVSKAILLDFGPLDDGSDGPKLGCRLLFREYAAAGYRFDDHWNLSATVEHASNANLCDGPNDGLTRAGLMLGYQF